MNEYEVQVTFHLKVHKMMSIEAATEQEAYDQAKAMSPDPDVEYDEFEVEAAVTDQLAGEE
jgi:hypothetical protein